jgi:hypothetical protein
LVNFHFQRTVAGDQRQENRGWWTDRVIGCTYPLYPN